MIVLNEDYNEMMPVDLTDTTAAITLSAKMFSREMIDETPKELQRIDISDMQCSSNIHCRHSNISLSSITTASSRKSCENQQVQHCRIPLSTETTPLREIQQNKKREVPIYIPKNWATAGFRQSLMKQQREPCSSSFNREPVVFPNQDDLSDISTFDEKDDDTDGNKKNASGKSASSTMVENLFELVSSVVGGRKPRKVDGDHKKNSIAIKDDDNCSIHHDSIIGKDIIICTSSMSLSQIREKSK